MIQHPPQDLMDMVEEERRDRLVLETQRMLERVVSQRPAPPRVWQTQAVFSEIETYKR